MPANVLIPTVLRNYVNGQSSVEVEGSTVKEVLDNLVKAHPSIKAHLFEADGKVRSFVNIFVNEDDIRHAGEMGAAVKSGDDISIVPSIAGGSAMDGMAPEARRDAAFDEGGAR